MEELGNFSLGLERLQKYEFKTTFDWGYVEPILVDEPEPLGGSKGPNASRLLGAAVGNCLSASLLFCLEKAKLQVNSLKTDVKGTLQRNEKGRLRIGRLDVQIAVDVQAETPQRTARCLELFEDYCIVTASVRKGIDIHVLVTDPRGNRLYEK